MSNRSQRSSRTASFETDRVRKRCSDWLRGDLKAHCASSTNLPARLRHFSAGSAQSTGTTASRLRLRCTQARQSDDYVGACGICLALSSWWINFQWLTSLLTKDGNCERSEDSRRGWAHGATFTAALKVADREQLREFSRMYLWKTRMPRRPCSTQADSFQPRRPGTGFS